MQTLKRLDDQARQVERTADGPSLETVIATERGRSASFGGRSVFGWEENVVKSEKPECDKGRQWNGCYNDVLSLVFHRSSRAVFANWCRLASALSAAVLVGARRLTRPAGKNAIASSCSIPSPRDGHTDARVKHRFKMI